MQSSPIYQKLFREALLIRMVEEKVIELYPSDKIQSPVHLSIGQEAVAVGVCHHLRGDDMVFGNYRGHAFYLAKGGGLKQMMAELYGKVTGCGRGKAGSMHLAAPEVGYMGSSAVVASTIPHAVGAAWAAKFRQSGQVTVALYGDGATEEGVYHESLNFAAMHQVPVLFVCENNGLAIHSHTQARQVYDITEHAKAYGITSQRITRGFDFVQIAETVGAAIDTVRRDSKPQVIEIITCRYKEHVGPGDDWTAGYRSRADYDKWLAQDPLAQDQASIGRYADAIRAEIDAAVSFAEESPWPGPKELLTDVI